jgi:hypothetical protein
MWTVEGQFVYRFDKEKGHVEAGLPPSFLSFWQKREQESQPCVFPAACNLLTNEQKNPSQFQRVSFLFLFFRQPATC